MVAAPHPARGRWLQLAGPQHRRHSSIDWLARNNGKVLSDDGTRVAFDQPAGQATLEWMLDATQRLYGSQQAYADALRGVSNSTYTGRQNLWVGQAARSSPSPATPPRRIPLSSWR